MDRSSRQKNNKGTLKLRDTLGKMVFIDMERTFHPDAAEYTFFTSTHDTFSRRHDMLGDKTNLNKFNRIEIISSIFCNENGMKSEINYRKKNRKSKNTWRLNNILFKKMGQ